MCTVIAAIGLSSQWPVLLATIRDESVERPWKPPAVYWPKSYPNIIGGLDLRSGGTWLALDMNQHCASFLINRSELIAGKTRSRGDLPLIALQMPGQLCDAKSLHQYNGFILGKADASGLTLYEWDTQTLHSVNLGKGIHGLCYCGIGQTHPRLARHLPGFINSSLPRPEKKSPVQAWGQWLDLLAGNGQYSSATDALIWRRNVGNSLWASQSAACLALGAQQSRLDFSSSPLDATSWHNLFFSSSTTSARTFP